MNNNLHEWLTDYQKIERDISYLHRRLEQNENELERWEGGSLSHVRIVKESKGAKLEYLIKKYREEIQFKKEQLKEIEQFISQFDDLETKILKLKYIDGCSLDIVAEKLDYSASYIKRKHAEIKSKIDFLVDNDYI